MKNPEGCHTFLFSYDRNNRLTRVCNDASAQRRYDYDCSENIALAGRVVHAIFPIRICQRVFENTDGYVINENYSAAVSGKATPAGALYRVATYTYDNQGNKIKASCGQ